MLRGEIRSRRAERIRKRATTAQPASIPASLAWAEKVKRVEESTTTGRQDSATARLWDASVATNCGANAESGPKCKGQSGIRLASTTHYHPYFRTLAGRGQATTRAQRREEGGSVDGK